MATEHVLLLVTCSSREAVTDVLHGLHVEVLHRRSLPDGKRILHVLAAPSDLALVRGRRGCEIEVLGEMRGSASDPRGRVSQTDRFKAQLDQLRRGIRLEDFWKEGGER